LEEIGSQAADLARKWWALQQDYYHDLSELNAAFARRSLEVLDDILEATPGSKASQARPDRFSEESVIHREIPIALAGSIDETVSQTFVLENHRTSTAEITFRISDITVADSGHSFHPEDLELRPERFSLPAGHEQAVALQLHLDASRFRPGERFHATIWVQGYPGLSLDLAIEVFAQAPPPTAGPGRRNDPAQPPVDEAPGRTSRQRQTPGASKRSNRKPAQGKP
jgi:hypothetical protein